MTVCVWQLEDSSWDNSLCVLSRLKGGSREKTTLDPNHLWRSNFEIGWLLPLLKHANCFLKIDFKLLNYRIVPSTNCELGNQLFLSKGHITWGSKIPYLSNLKKPVCASKRDVLELTTLRYLNVDAPNSMHYGKLILDQDDLFRIFHEWKIGPSSNISVFT